MNDSPTPLREATSFLSILAFLTGVGCYFAQVNHVPVLDEILSGLGSILFGWFPTLSQLKIPQAQALISAVAASLLFFAAGVPFTPALSRMFGPRVSDMEAQMRWMQGRRRPRTVNIK